MAANPVSRGQRAKALQVASYATQRDIPLSGEEVRALIDLTTLEAAWQAQIEAVAVAEGFNYWHDNDSRENDASFPDLVCWRERLIFFECKKMGGILSVDRVVKGRRGYHFRKGQAPTILALLAAQQEIYIARPCDWERVRAVLARDSTPDNEWLELTRSEAERRVRGERRKKGQA